VPQVHFVEHETGFPLGCHGLNLLQLEMIEQARMPGAARAKGGGEGGI
jgi:hypothetical protein